ncbi:hypothetical protein PSHT_01368 [Puccinia striiformis]|uniref:Uncharacterized protein n=1 Tax=Puccinia striiformis TaxID=27350 RepID=A0A2S4WKW3_9BASI|nr:hypothetical protein PSHT_01368 [Puccinia striiformis]
MTRTMTMTAPSTLNGHNGDSEPRTSTGKVSCQPSIHGSWPSN